MVSPCTLPVWAQEEDVADMNTHFGGLLKEVLQHLMSNHLKLCSRSVGSQNSQSISNESFHLEDNDVSVFRRSDDTTPFK